MPNVLLVDDEEDICDFLKEQLEEVGYKVFTAFSGEKAIEIIRNQQLDLAVIDLRLSTVLTGIDVIKAVQEKWPEAAVIAMSGYVDINLRQETGRLGVEAYFVKPDDVHPEIFIRKIQELLTRPKKT